MNLSSSLKGKGSRSAFAVFLGLAITQGTLLADGVTRSIQSVPAGYQVTLAWDFTGTIESDLIIEERFAQGWSVKTDTIPFASLDATWFNGSVARFAVKPTLLAQSGSISFTIVPGSGATGGGISGDWQIYLGGEKRKEVVAGASVLTFPKLTSVGSPNNSQLGQTESSATPTDVAITAFKAVNSGCELSYESLAKPGTLVVEGCQQLGGTWSDVKRVTVDAGPGKVNLKSDEVGSSRFMRVKFLTTGE